MGCKITPMGCIQYKNLTLAETCLAHLLLNLQGLVQCLIHSKYLVIVNE